MNPIQAWSCLPNKGQVWEEATVDVLDTHSLCHFHFLSTSAVKFSLAFEAPFLMRLYQDVWLWLHVSRRCGPSQECPWIICAGYYVSVFPWTVNWRRVAFGWFHLTSGWCGLPIWLGVTSAWCGWWPWLLQIELLCQEPYQVTWLRILYRHVRWKRLSLHVCLPYTVHVSHVNRRMGRKMAQWTLSLFTRLIPLLYQTVSSSLLKMTLALATLQLTSSTMWTSLKRVPPSNY